MKIHFDNVQFTSQTGPNCFANRLARQLFETGNEITTSCVGADISLVFIEKTGMKLAPIVVQRLDGIWFKPDEFHNKNKYIKSLYEMADAVVFQSKFDKSMIEHHWSVKNTFEVIPNGIIQEPVKQLTIPKLAEMRASYDKIFVCSANWHPQKRLKSNVELFNHIRNNFYSNSCLIVLGNNPDYVVPSPHIFYAGSVDSTTYMQIYSVANWMLHLAWADHCPNVVVEALSQGTPVICSEVGGTKELVGDYGIVLKEKQYNYELFNYDVPPTIDVTQIKELPIKEQLDYKSIVDIDIATTTKNYLKLFNQLKHSNIKI